MARKNKGEGEDAEKDPDAPDPRREMYIRAGGLVLMAVALILFMSVASLNPHDPPNGDVPEMDPPANICGIVGACVGYLVYLFFGWGSYLVIFTMAGIGAYMLLLRPVSDRLVRSAGGVVFLVSFCGLCALLFTIGHGPGGAGGMLGFLIADGLLRPVGTGGYVIALVGLLVGAFLAADAWVMWIGRKGVDAIKRRVVVPEGEPAPEETPEPAAEAGSEGGRLSIAEQKELLRKRIEERKAEEAALAKTEATAPAPPATEEKPAPEAAKPAPTPTMEERAQAATVVAKPKEPPKPKPKKVAREPIGDWHLPGLELLDPPDPPVAGLQDENIEQKRETLERTLEEFGIAAQVVEIDRGPVITQFELELAPGVKIGKIIGLSDDMARSLKATSVRVVAPIPGKSTVGVEVPNTHRETVRLRQILDSGVLQRKRMTLPILLGKDSSGEPLVGDLAQMPHLLIAGATGSGKSVCMNSIIMSIMLTQSPSDVKLILIDPKMVELSAFRDIPHLMAPVLTDMKKAQATLEWGTRKMDERYSFLANVGVRNIASFNALGEAEIRKRLDLQEGDDLEGVIFHMPYIVIIIDELADLMMVSGKEVESTITRLAQKSRAVGIHLIVATQRPSTDVVTGLIKANLPSRVAFQTASMVDSRTILDRNGAEKLLGKGDMLFLPPGSSKLTRGQGCYTSDEEIKRTIEWLTARAKPDFEEELLNPGAIDGSAGAAEDELFPQAVRIILESQRGSVSLLQRKLGIGYSRASRLIDLMGEAGIVGEYKGSVAREVLLSLEEWDAQQGGDGGGGAPAGDAPPQQT
jgi:S-DNA-T family DNA segregation ATPase FtsK/SpoIIIE